MSEPVKSIVSVSEMARMVGLSRQRFYQLRGTTFPEPLRDEKTKRPYYDEELQAVCLEVRRRNCGIDGRPVLFYAPRTCFPRPLPKPPKKATKPQQKNHYTAIADAVRSLGLTSVRDQQVAAAVRELFPGGISDTPESEVIRAVFVQMQRQNSRDNQGK